MYGRTSNASRRCARCVCVVALFSIVAGCGFNRVTRSPELSVTSKAREREIGREEAKKVETAMGTVKDPALNDYIDRIGQRLAELLAVRENKYTFSIIDSQVPNAFALPGGYVFITRGMLALLNSEDELACVMGHEIAHVAARHSARQKTRSILTSPFSIVTSIAGATTGIILPRVGGLISGVGQITTGAVLASYSREHEREADQIGMDLAAKAGWNPSGMTSMLTTLKRNEKLVAGHVKIETGFLDSHPSTPEREAETAKLAGELAIGQQHPFAVDRRAFFGRLAGMLVGSNPAEGIFIKQRFMQPELHMQLEFPEGWQLHNARSAVAAAELDQRAAILMQLVGEGDDPLIAAHARRKQFGFSLDEVEATKINGLPASRVVIALASRQGKAKMQITWIVFENRIYELTGVTRAEDFPRFEPVFVATANSFKALRATDRAAIKADRLTVATAAPSETVHQLLDRVNSTWSPAVAAVANAVTEDGPLPAGLAMKAPVAVPYAAK